MSDLNTSATNSNQILLNQAQNFASNQLFSSLPLNPPSCIVIGCKNGNGQSNSHVKYYQVPFIHQYNNNNSQTVSNVNTARQWYINTLREDLLDYVNSQQFNQNPIHFVCIEHFDEESFIITNTSNLVNSNSENQSVDNQEIIMILKEDAVPSLFEIEVFQKMIAHQEQISLNQQLLQQQQQQQQYFPQIIQPLPQQQQQQQPRSSLLSNLILNDSINQSYQSFNKSQPLTINNTQNSLDQQKKNKINESSSTISLNKRTRIDPDLRATLMQRVPKAVKRTSFIGNRQSMQQSQVQHVSNLLTPPAKMQKAVKHTMPRQNQLPGSSSSSVTIINDIAPSASPTNLIKINNNTLNTASIFSQNLPNSSSNSTSTSTSNVNNVPKLQKAVKHTSNIFLKEFLPPPIMQSTKRSPSSTPSIASSINKAVKHTGGGSSLYYQNKSALNLNKPNNTNQLAPQQQQQIIQSSNSEFSLGNSKTPVLTSLVTGSASTNLLLNETKTKNTTSNNPNLNNTTTNNNNKITITTTYVYKRVLNPPDIDLDLECEEEEIEYIQVAPQPKPTSILAECETSKLDIQSTKDPLSSIELPKPISLDQPKDQVNEILPKAEIKELIQEAAPVSLSIPIVESNLNTSDKNDQVNENVIEKPQLKNETPITPIISQENEKLSKTSEKKTDDQILTNEKKLSNNTNEKPITPTLDKSQKTNKPPSPKLSESIKCMTNTEVSQKSNKKTNNAGTSSSKALPEKAIDSLKKKAMCKNNVSAGTQEIKKESKKSLSTTPLHNSSENSMIIKHQILFSKYYSRKQGALYAALEDSSNNEGSSTSNNKKSRTSLSSTSVTTNQSLPADLRIGKYPAKCNVCNIILENNIKLTSHICSHLESSGNTNELNTYISPFDAVTTTCGICDLTFSQPYELIKHLDLKHMKQLDEFKCRICERQHSKQSDLIAHLNETHSQQEMPYRCDACGFRTSFYADAIYHIKKEHTSTLRHFCPYCLKSLALPFNKKLGYVQCNLFYSHLITHFNKHENNTLMPSKCKHCQKCILHVRYMKEHLMYDHNDNEQDTNNEQSLKDETSFSKKNLRTTRQKEPINFKVESSVDEKDKKYNLRKRQRSTFIDENNDEEEYSQAESNLDNVNEQSMNQSRKSLRNVKLKEIKKENFLDNDAKKPGLRKRHRTTLVDQNNEEDGEVEIEKVEAVEIDKTDIKEASVDCEKKIGKKRRVKINSKINDDYDAADEDEDDDENVLKQQDDEVNTKIMDEYEFDEKDSKSDGKAKNKNQSKIKVNKKSDIIETPITTFKPKFDSSKADLTTSKLLSLKSESKDPILESTTASALATLAEVAESLEEVLANQVATIPTTTKRGPKANKQKDLKNKKPKTIQTATRRTYRNRTTSQENDASSTNSKDLSPTLPTSQVSALIFGNVRFKCIKNEFKCIECDDTDLKTHYKNVYTCHQCFYNTNCSKSFEFHLHGHLVKKRVALWNKPVKTNAEVYNCPCGFKINSELDNNNDANTGNKVAAHLLQCDYKYCKFSLSHASPIVDKNNDIDPISIKAVADQEAFSTINDIQK